MRQRQKVGERQEMDHESRVIDQPKNNHSHDFVTEAKQDVTNNERRYGVH